ncbi:MAG TPA: methyltransferase [Nocardioides sp.]|nr:methyltransferase [Nocardioides sp.]
MDDDPVRSVLWMVRGAWVTMALRGACSLGVFDVLEQPRDLAEVAEATRTDPPTLARLLRCMADLGMVERVGTGGYHNSALGATLAEGHPSRMRDLLLMQATLPNLAAWGAVDDAVRTGSGVFERVNGMPSWQHLAGDPEAQRRFNASMARRASGQVAALLGATDLAEFSTLIDVGGGRGAMVAGLLERTPSLRGIVADQAAMAAEADELFAAEGMAARARGEACDFFVSVPGGGDVYTISNVLHDWDDGDAVSILRTVRAAMPDHARLLVVEHVLDAPGRSADELRDIHLVDLHMLVMFGARERTQAEYDALLAEAGFTASRMAEPVTEWNVLEADPAR